MFVGRTDLLGLDFTTCWGTIRAEDKTAPTLIADAAGSTLLCVDVAANDLSLLPSTVDRCYQVNSVTGATLPGTHGPRPAPGSEPVQH